MQAPHAGACHRCHGAIATGEPIRSFNRPAVGTWYHLACVGVKVAPSATLAPSHATVAPSLSANGHVVPLPASAPLAAPRILDTLASALAGRTEPPCPCSWLGVSYDERCAWLLAAARAARRPNDSWRTSDLDALAQLATTSATPDVARDLECYALGMRHGMAMLGADIADPVIDVPAAEPMPYGAYLPPGAGDGHVGYGSLWDIANGDDGPSGLADADAEAHPDIAACACTLVEGPDGMSTLTTCAACLAAATGQKA